MRLTREARARRPDGGMVIYRGTLAQVRAHERGVVSILALVHFWQVDRWARIPARVRPPALEPVEPDEERLYAWAMPELSE